MTYSTRNNITEQQHDKANTPTVAAQFADNRASASQQLKKQILMASSPKVTMQRAAINAMNTSLVQQQKIIQRAAPEEELQMRAIAQSAQLADMEDEESLQGKFETAQRVENEELLQGNFESAQRAEKPNNTGLPNQLKAGIENLSGMNMDHVQVHYNSSQPAQLNAHAYAQGSDIHVAPGQEKHLPHEAWHVVQQAQGRVKPTMQMKGNVPVNDDVGLESEADVMGAKALQRAALIDKDNAPSLVQPSVSTLQRKIWVGDNHIIHYDDNLVAQQILLVQPYISQWDQIDTVFDAGTASKTRAAKTKYFTDDFEGDIRAMLRKYNEKKSFTDDKDLTRQLVQDIKLTLLKMDSIVGTDHTDGQYSQVADDKSVGRDGKAKKLRIYRTMPYTAWKNYQASNDLKDILWGHGGSLGQALDYFMKSKASKLDDVLVEFEFAGTAQSLVDYTEVKKGGEGGAPKGDKFTGKNEKNDILGLDKEIFSINLGKSKDFIVGLNPKVTLKDQALSVHL